MSVGMNEGHGKAYVGEVEAPYINMIVCIDCKARFPANRLDMLGQHSEAFHVAKKWTTYFTEDEMCKAIQDLLQLLSDEGYGVIRSAGEVKESACVDITFVTIKKFKP
mgnify:CR=1 FL=1